MNKLKSDINGGFPFELDDLRFMDDAYREGFEGVLSGFETPVFIISGCVASVVGLNLVVTSGFVAYQGEVLRLPTQTIPFNTSGEYFVVIDTTFDPNGLEAFEDTTVNNTYEVRTAKVVYSLIIPPSSPNVLATMPTMKDLIVGMAESANPVETFRFRGFFPPPTFTGNVYRSEFAHGIPLTGTTLAERLRGFKGIFVNNNYVSGYDSTHVLRDATGLAFELTPTHVKVVGSGSPAFGIYIEFFKYVVTIELDKV